MPFNIALVQSVHAVISAVYWDHGEWSWHLLKAKHPQEQPLLVHLTVVFTGCIFVSLEFCDLVPLRRRNCGRDAFLFVVVCALADNITINNNSNNSNNNSSDCGTD